MGGFLLGGQTEQRLTDDQTRMIARNMRELHPARNIANCKDAAVRGPHACVHLDTGLCGLDPCGFEVQAVGV